MDLSFGGVTNVAYNLPRALAKKVMVTYYPTFIPRRSYVVYLLDVYRRLAIKDFDVVHFNVSPGWIDGRYSLFKLAKINSASTLLNIHGIIQVEYQLYNLKTNWFWFTSYKGLSSTLRYCKIADKIVTYSKFMQDNIVTWYGLNRDKIAVIPNGVDIRKFSEHTGELLLEGNPSILYIGALVNFKSPDLIIRAISRLQSELPELKLHLVGAGDREALEWLARKKGVAKQVIFHGRIAPQNAPRYYKAADFCIFPSRRDSAGITLLEAMASGTPVIASNRGGTPEIIRHNENGVLFEPSDAESLPNAIIALHQDPELKKKVSRNALKTVLNYSWENIAEKYVTLYQSLREAHDKASL